MRVTYLFGLAHTAEGRMTQDVVLPAGATLFEVLRQLGVSALELHAAVNGESALDGTELHEGDEVTLIPAIQGGAEEDGPWTGA